MSNRAVWVVALVLTVASAVWQRRSGPTRPVRGTVDVAGAPVSYRLLRSHGGDGDQPVRVTAADGSVSGRVVWRRFPTSEAWRELPMARTADGLEAFLPHQPPAGKLEYQVRLRKGETEVAVPARTVVTRFKGHVHATVLVPHVVAMLLSMLLSAAAGLTALLGRPTRRLTLVTLAVIAAGGFVLGPIVQKLAFGEYWTGFPYGHDLTDNKTLLAGVAWGLAALAQLRGREGRWWVVAAAAVTLAVFAIPHSLWGSQVDWTASGAPAPR